jgi:hypothetical protein
MPKRMSLRRAASVGAKDTLAVACITIGVQYINSGDYLVGGGLVAFGWILLVTDRLVGH